MVIILDSVSGKKEDLILKYPKSPRTTSPNMMIFTATGYFIKYEIIFFIIGTYLASMIDTFIPGKAPGTDLDNNWSPLCNPLTITESSL